MLRKLIPVLMFYTLGHMLYANDVLTCVNKECITKSDVIHVAQMQYGIKEHALLDDSIKKKILKGLQDKLLVINAAKTAKLNESQAYKESLENASKAILANLYLKNLKEQIVITPDEILAYYQKHKDRYYTRVHTRTILNTSEKKIKIYIEELKQVPLSERKTAFMEIAKKYSQHISRHKEGDLGFIGYDSMVQPFGKEAFKLKVNEITLLPVKTTLGYHIIYIEEIQVRPIEVVHTAIENTLVEEKYRETFEDILQKLRENTEITNEKSPTIIEVYLP